MFILLGIILALGFEIRVILGICLIAILITNFLKRKNINSGIILVGFIIGIIIYKIIAMPFGVLKNKDIEFPITHWITYSLNEETNGKWNEQDYTTTFNQKTYEEKVSTNIETIKTRLKDLGLSGLLTLTKEKLAVNWSNGEYNYFNKMENVEQINVLYEYFAGNKRLFIMYYLQICKVVLMITLLIAVARELMDKSDNKKYQMIYITIFGAFLFYMIWEVATRYSLSFLPLIALLFERGISSFERILEIKSIKIQKHKIDMQKILKNVSLGVIILTVFLSVINFEKYAVKKQEYFDKVVVQTKGEGEAKKIAKDEIIQTFVADKKFNSIAIKFKKENTKEKTNYCFVLYDSNKNELVRKGFNSKGITNGQYRTFKFDYIEPKGKQEYSIKIYSENATEDNSIGIYVYNGSENYEMYPSGKMTINGEEVKKDITFKVQNDRKRTYISKKMYIAIILIIVIIEIYAFYPYIKNEEKYIKKKGLYIDGRKERA